MNSIIEIIFSIIGLAYLVYALPALIRDPFLEARYIRAVVAKRLDSIRLQISYDQRTLDSNPDDFHTALLALLNKITRKSLEECSRDNEDLRNRLYEEVDQWIKSRYGELWISLLVFVLLHYIPSKLYTGVEALIVLIVSSRQFVMICLTYIPYAYITWAASASSIRAPAQLERIGRHIESCVTIAALLTPDRIAFIPQQPTSMNEITFLKKVKPIILNYLINPLVIGNIPLNTDAGNVTADELNRLLNVLENVFAQKINELPKNTMAEVIYGPFHPAQN